MSVVDAAGIRALVPHTDAMCLLQSALSWDAARIHCRADNHRDPDHPLAEHGTLSALYLIEYGAQAMAVHGGLLAREAGGTARPGLLVSVRDVVLHVERIDTIMEPLDVIAERRLAGDSGWLYAFHVSAGEKRLAHGRVMVLPASGSTRR